MRKGFRELIAEAEAEIETIDAAAALVLLGRDDVVMVDIRDAPELARDGCIPGAFHAPRAYLEFWVDPTSPWHKPVFASGKRFVLYCAGGLRSALAAQTLRRMGLDNVCHVRGGLTAWKAAGGPVVGSGPG